MMTAEEKKFRLKFFSILFFLTSMQLFSVLLLSDFLTRNKSIILVAFIYLISSFISFFLYEKEKHEKKAKTS